jgi:hypothetical protein
MFKVNWSVDCETKKTDLQLLSASWDLFVLDNLLPSLSVSSYDCDPWRVCHMTATKVTINLHLTSTLLPYFHSYLPHRSTYSCYRCDSGTTFVGYSHIQEQVLPVNNKHHTLSHVSLANIGYEFMWEWKLTSLSFSFFSSTSSSSFLFSRSSSGFSSLSTKQNTVHQKSLPR